MTTPPDLTLYYDGACHLCSREIAWYRKRAGDDASVRFVDIADPQFEAESHGLDAKAIHRHMHVKVGEELRTGVDAFIALWQRLKGFGGMARMARWPGIYQILKIGYAIFAWVRPMLPRRKVACESGVCER